MEPSSVTLVFEPSPEESGLLGVDEAVRSLRRIPDDDGLFAKALRFWFPYLSKAGVIGVTPGVEGGGEFTFALASIAGQAFSATLADWLQGRRGRKVRVKFKGVELEAQTREEAESLFSRLQAMREDRNLAQA